MSRDPYGLEKKDEYSTWDEPSPFNDSNKRNNPYGLDVPDYTPESDIEESDRGEFSKGFLSGIDQVQALAGGAFSLAGDYFDNEFMFERGLEYYQKNMEEASAYKPKVGSYKDVYSGKAFTRVPGTRIPSVNMGELVSGFGRAADYINYMAGNVIPSIGSTILGGGITGGSAKYATRKLMEKRAKDYTDKAIKRNLLIAGTAGTYTGTFSVASSQISGDAFMEIYEETGNRSPTEALIAGAAGGALDILVPVRLLKKAGGSVLDDTLRNLNKGKGHYDGLLTQALLNGGLEGFTEAMQEALILSAVDVAQGDNTGANWYNEFKENLAAPENRERLINAGIAGFIAGGGVTGAVGGYQGQKRKLNERQFAAGGAQAFDVMETAEPSPATQGLEVDETVTEGGAGRTVEEQIQDFEEGRVQPTRSGEVDFSVTPEGDVVEGRPDPTRVVPKTPFQQSERKDSLGKRAQDAQRRGKAINDELDRQEAELEEERQALVLSYDLQKSRKRKDLKIKKDLQLSANEEVYVEALKREPHKDITWIPPNSALTLLDDMGGLNTVDFSEFDPLPGFRLPQNRRNPFRTRGGRKGEKKTEYIGKSKGRYLKKLSDMGLTEWDQVVEVLQEQKILPPTEGENLTGQAIDLTYQASKIIEDEIEYYESKGRSGQIYSWDQNWQNKWLEKQQYREYLKDLDQELFGDLTTEERVIAEKTEEQLAQKEETPETIAEAEVRAEEDVEQARAEEEIPEDIPESVEVDARRVAGTQEERGQVQSDRPAPAEPAQETQPEQVDPALELQSETDGIGAVRDMFAETKADTEPEAEPEAETEAEPEPEPDYLRENLSAETLITKEEVNASISHFNKYTKDNISFSLKKLNDSVEANNGITVFEFFDWILQYGMRRNDPSTVTGWTLDLEKAILAKHSLNDNVTLGDLFETTIVQKPLEKYFRYPDELNNKVDELVEEFNFFPDHNLKKSYTLNQPISRFIDAIVEKLDAVSEIQTFSYDRNKVWESSDALNLTNEQRVVSEAKHNVDGELFWQTESQAKKAIEILGLQKAPRVKVVRYSTGIIKPDFFIEYNPADPNLKEDFDEGWRVARLSPEELQIANEQETWGTKIDPTRSRAGSFEKTQVEWGKAQDTVNEFTKNYKGLERVKFRVTRTASDIEDRTGFSEQDKAVYDPADQTIYIFSDKHLDEADVLRTLQHETIGHFGLSKLLDEKDLNTLVKKVRASRLQSKQFKKIYDDVAKRYKGREESVIAEEVIARIAETTNFDSRFERVRDQIFELIAKALRSIGLTKGQISQAEIRNLLRESEALIKNKIALPSDEISRLSRAEAMGFATGTTVYHGSVGTFDQFDPYMANPAGHFGKGFYFSDSEYDVDINYAGTSGESVAMEIDDIKEFAESYEEQRLNMKKRFGVEEEGQIRSTVIPAYLKMKKPFDLTKGNTWFEFEYEYDEEGDIIPDTESGTGMDLLDAIETVSYEYNVNSNKLLSELEIWDGIEANELVKRLMMADEVMYVEDFASELSSGEFIRRVIEELGYDGIVMNASETFPGMNMPKGTKHYIVFKPTQIRRTDAKFDPLEEASPLIYARKEEDDGDNAYNLSDERLHQYYIRKFQDTFHRVKMLESEVAKARGKERIESKESTYVGEALYYGKVETAIEKLNGEFLRPIGRKLSEYKISMEELDLYLYAKHAQERNEHIAEINEDMPDGGSGMTNEEADTVLNKAEEEGKVEQLEELANEVYKITSGTRDLLRDTGLIEEDLLNAWQEAYEFYVPLKGAASDQSQYGSGTGKGFSVSGKESLRAMGRQSKAHSPFAQVYADRVEKIIRSEKNALGVKFYNFVQDNPNSDLFTIWTEDNAPPSRTIQERVDPETKEKSQEVVTVNSLYQAKQETVVVREDPYRFNNTKVPEGFARMWTTEKTIPKYFSVKIPVTKEDEAGANQTTTEEVLIEIKDPLLNLAMHRAGMDEMSKIASFLLRYNRLLSAVNTQFNPVFVPTNFIRDVQTAVAALEGEKTREGGLLRGEQTEQLTQNILEGLQSRVKNYYKFTRAQLRDKKLKNLTQEQIEEQRWFNEYLEDGAKTAFFYTRTIEEVQADVNKIIADQTSQPTLRKRVTGGAVAFGRIVEDLNTAVENGVRFSTYIEARKAGVDRETAAFIAKTLTVNFNKKGDWGNDLNSYYLFYNAAMQGVANVARFGEALIMKPSLNKLANGQSLNNAQKLASGTVALAAIAAFGNEWLSEDDEDGESFYSKISDYEKERNFIFMNPYNGEDYVKFPLPYGYNTFHNLGTAMAETSMGIKEPTEAAWFWGVGFVNSFNPVGGSIMPTIIQPHWEISKNENWRGAPIYKEDMFGQNIPDSSKAMGRLPEAASRSWMINWAKWMNRTSGGTENITGGVDISPDTIEHLIDFHMGGAGRFVTNIIDTSADIAKGKRVERQGIPGLRRLYGEPNPQENAKRYFENITELDQLYNEYESLAEKDWKKAEEFRLKNRQVDLAEDVKDWKEDLSEYREMIRYIKNSENYSQQEKNVKIKDYEEKMNSLYMQFNYHYNSYEALSK